jgi:hypothetical protein
VRLRGSAKISISSSQGAFDAAFELTDGQIGELGQIGHGGCFALSPPLLREEELQFGLDFPEAVTLVIIEGHD